MDWKNPAYGDVFLERLDALARLRANPGSMPALRAYYRENPADFISDWGVTFDPRNAELERPTLIPFVLFPKQREWVEWVLKHWTSQTPGLCEKSRDMGISWLATSLACTLCLFREGVAIGFGSRKEEYVDKIGTMKPLLPKARMFMENLPEEFRGGWVPWRDAPFMRVNFPDTGSLIMGEAGDQIGRGDRASIYFVDESAYLERPDLVEHSLSQTTNCRIDMSSVNGMNNPFAKKRHGGKVDVFVFDWRDDPRKDEAWYAKQVEDLDPVTVAQEIDRDYSASVHGIVIPGAWVRACIDACEKIGIKPTGARQLALDVADEGIDKNALVGTTGIEIDYLDEWSGKGGDIFETVTHAFSVCDVEGYGGFRYDSDGLGAGVRGDARVINESRKKARVRQIVAEAFRGSDGVLDPDGLVYPDARDKGNARKNKDYFLNRKAQGWWSLRTRAYKTYRWVVGGVSCHPDEIVSISSKAPLYQKLVTELSQPTYRTNEAGKIIVNKMPEGMKSPNLGDGAMMRLASAGRVRVVVSAEALAASMRLTRRR